MFDDFMNENGGFPFPMDTPDGMMDSADTLDGMEQPPLSTSDNSFHPSSIGTPSESNPPQLDGQGLMNIKKEPSDINEDSIQDSPAISTLGGDGISEVKSQDGIGLNSDIKEEEENKESLDPVSEEELIDRAPFFTPEALEMYRRREKESFQQQKQSLEYINQMMLERRKWADSVGKRFQEFKNIVHSVMQTREKMIQAKRPGHEKVGFTIIKPEDRKKVRKCRDFIFSDTDLEQISEKEDVLVPIRLDIELEGFKLRDTFTWNLNETLITPEIFAENLVEDLLVPIPIVTTMTGMVARSIREQIEDYFQHAPSHLKTAATAQEVSTSEIRILIKLDITVGTISLVDQVEWDLNCPANEPEVFATRMARELKLPCEFMQVESLLLISSTAIAHSIREQSYAYAKSLLLIDHKFDGAPVTEDEELAAAILPPLPGMGKRYQVDAGPSVFEMTDADMERLEKEFERESRRKRRTHRSRRAITLPDREPAKTRRTLVPPFGKAPEETLAQANDDSMSDDNTSENFAGRNVRRSRMMAQERMAQDQRPVQERPAAPLVVNLAEAVPSAETISTLKEWKCGHCGIPSTQTPLKRNGPRGPNTLCNSCGIYYLQNNTLLPIQETPQADSGADTVMHLDAPVPDWIDSELKRLSSLFPDDIFSVKEKKGSLRIKCADCVGKLYTLGPGDTLQNFEIHLKNKQHRSNVQARLEKI